MQHIYFLNPTGLRDTLLSYLNRLSRVIIIVPDFVSLVSLCFSLPFEVTAPVLCLNQLFVQPLL